MGTTGSNLLLVVSAAVVAIPLSLCVTLYAQGQRLKRLDGGARLTNELTKDYAFNPNDIVTVFCQGNGASRAQASKYAGIYGLDIRLDEAGEITDRVYIANSPRLLWNLYAWPDLDDIGYGFSWNPVHWISACMHDLVLIMGYNLRGMYVLPHNRPTYLNVAGHQDVTQYLSAVSQCIVRNPTKRLVLFGTSRGASTVLVALCHLSDAERKHIALVLVEGPFDTVTHVTDWQFGRVAPLVRWAMKTFTLYRESQDSPLDAIRHARFPMEIPLGFIRSAVDNVVPVECTQPLITGLKARGHTMLHELVLKRSHHSRMSIDDAEDQESYLRFVYALYDRYAKPIGVY